MRCIFTSPAQISGHVYNIDSDTERAKNAPEWSKKDCCVPYDFTDEGIVYFSENQ